MAGAAQVLVVGSVNADLVVAVERLPGPGETVTGGRFSRHGGGKGANQAVAAARLGAAVALIGAVGADELGDEAVGALRSEGVDVRHVQRSRSTSTGVALIAVDARGENQIAVASGANAELGADAVGAGTAAEGAVVLLGHEVPPEAVLAGARAARGPIVLNPAPARALPDELLALGPVLTPNAFEACELTGEREPAAAAAALAARTRAAVLVTLGERGVLVLDAGETQLLAPPLVAVVDTTGAGDTFNGALATELAAGRELRAAAAFAVAAAALSCRVAGAREGMPRRADVEAAIAGRQ